MAQGKRSDVGTDVRRDSSHQFNPQSVTQQLVHVQGEGDHGGAHLGGGGAFTLSAATMERRVESPFNLKYPNCVYNEDKAATNKKRKDVTWGRGITNNLPTLLLTRKAQFNSACAHDNNLHSTSISPVSKIDKRQHLQEAEVY